MKDKQKAFDPIFEEKLIQTILVDHDFGLQLMEVMEPSNFDLVHTEALAKLLKEYYFQYETFPSADLLPAIIGEKVSNPIIIKKCQKYIEKIQKEPLNGDLEYVKDKALEFFRKQHITRTLADDVLPLLEGETSRLEEILPLIQSALVKGTENDIGYEYHDDEEERFNVEDIEGLPSPWKIVNQMLKGGGWGKKRVVTFIAPPGAGKSSFLVNCAAEALLEAKTVIYYTFELDWREIAEKFDARLTGVEIDNIIGNKRQVLLKLRQSLPENARLIIKEYPVRGASIQTIKAHLTKLKLKGVKPDLIVIDQGGNLKSVNKHNKEERFNLSDNWLDMKNLAQTERIPVLTAHQVNRTGYNDDIILPDQIAGCFDILGTTDILITMARNMTQKALGLGRMYVAKNRQGKDGIILAYAINTAKCLIDVFEITDEVEQMFADQKEQEELEENKDLRGKLRKFINSSTKKNEEENEQMAMG